MRKRKSLLSAGLLCGALACMTVQMEAALAAEETEQVQTETVLAAEETEQMQTEAVLAAEETEQVQTESAAAGEATQPDTETGDAGEVNITVQSYQAVLDQVTSRIRWAGTPQEREAALEIAQTMKSFGYEVEQQSFPFTEYAQGKQDSTEAVNVIAVKEADAQPNGDILIVSAHHDTKQSTTGANDNASGTALLLELARVMRDVPSDTEIRFISFSAEEAGLKGSQYYVSTLSDEEKSRIIGDIQIDMIGHYTSDTAAVKTTQGQEELIGRMLLDASVQIGGSAWETGVETASDHSSFLFGGVPAVLVTQDVFGGAENHRFIDNASIIDAKKAVDTGLVIEEVLREVASQETPSLVQEAFAMRTQDAAVEIKDSTPILFGVDKETVDVKVGAGGTLEKEGVGEYGYEVAHYIVNARWFGWEALPTDFEYRKSDKLLLENVYIRTDSLGLSDEELAERLTEVLGEPQIFEDGSKLWGADTMAENPSLRQYQISEVDGKQVIWVFSGIHTLVGDDITTYDFEKPQEEYKGTGDTADLALLEAVHRIVPQDDSYMKQVVSWTDGYSNMLGSCTAADMEASDEFVIRLDKNDFFDSEGNIIDEGKLLATAVHEYGHALTLNAEQIDTSKVETGVSYNDMELYFDDSYMKAFYDEFYADGKQRDFYEHPEDYVNEYAGMGGVSEDIAESFMQFVVGKEQDSDYLAAQKINFFYDYPQMVEIRDYIRENYGL